MRQEEISSAWRQDHAFFVLVVLVGRRTRAAAHNPLAEHSDLRFAVVDEHDGPVVIAHEILHLFGAVDLYQEGTAEFAARDLVRDFLTRELRRTLSAEEIDRSIMLNTTGRELRDVGVDRFTARCIGWVDELPEKPTGYATRSTCA